MIDTIKLTKEDVLRIVEQHLREMHPTLPKVELHVTHRTDYWYSESFPWKDGERREFDGILVKEV
jgi:hypothetical protein